MAGILNPFLLRKWGALLLCGMFSTIGFAIGSIFYNFLWGVGLMLVCLLVSVLLGSLLLKNPFTLILEGKGILTIDITSTGVLRPFILRVVPPFVQGKLNKKVINDIFDREAVFNLATPVKAGTAQRQQDGGININLNEEEYNRGRFALFHYPTFLFNSQINSIITKEFISEQEKKTFAEHGILFLNRKMEELTSVTRDFARYVVEQTKPGKPFWKSGWMWVIVVVLFVVLAAMFFPSIIGVISKTAGSAQGAFSGAGNVFNPAS